MILFGTGRIIRKQCAELAPRLYRLAWSWCRDADLADDLVQETLARALERADQLQDASKILPWMSRIMVNLYRDRQRRERDHLALDQVELSGGDATMARVDRSDEVQRVREAVACLRQLEKELWISH